MFAARLLQSASVPLIGLALCSFFSLSVEAQEVEVISEQAAVKVGTEVIGSVKKGERYTAVRAQFPWVAIAIEQEGKRRVGWVLGNHVRTIVAPSFEENTAAPEAPAAIHVDVDLTQVNGTNVQTMVVRNGAGRGGAFAQHVPMRFYGNPGAAHVPACYLCCRLSLRNDTIEPVASAATDFKLRVDDHELVGLEPARLVQLLNLPGVVYLMGDPREPAPLPDGPLAPTEIKQGWLCFDLTSLPVGDDLVRMPKAEKWVLHAKLGEHEVDLDLKANEITALNVKARPSQLDASVKVVEIGSRLNALNLAKLITTLEALKTESAVVFHESAQCLFDDAAQTFFRAIQPRQWGGQPPTEPRFPQLVHVRPNTVPGRSRRNFGFPFDQRATMVGMTVVSEPLAALRILGERTGTAAQIIQQLSHQDAQIRAAAAQSLVKHLASEGAIDGLVKATKDEDPSVRVSSLRVLGAILMPAPPGARQPDSADTAAVVAAMRDPNQAVRNAAAAAARAFPAERVEGDLISLLADADFSVRMEACQSLGALKSQAAIPRLKELSAAAANDQGPVPPFDGQKQAANAAVKTAALNALVAIGAITALDAAIEKLSTGNPAHQDFALLAEGQDERIVPALIEFVQSNPNDNSFQAVQTLGQLGDDRAVEPLLDVLKSVRAGSETAVVQALGELRDRRAIEPLRKRLARSAGIEARINYLCALILLDDRAALEEAKSLLGTVDKLNQPLAAQLLEALGECGYPKVPELIEPFLDDVRYSRFAAKALANTRLPKAYNALQTRLRSAKYAYGPSLVNALAENRSWALSPHGQGILKDAAQSANPSTRASAEGVLRSLDVESQPKAK